MVLLVHQVLLVRPDILALLVYLVLQDQLVLQDILVTPDQLDLNLGFESQQIHQQILAIILLLIHQMVHSHLLYQQHLLLATIFYS